ncbi:MAG: hypothetical protein AB2705_20675 [Candidatus Thiodiazotropha sp.]
MDSSNIKVEESTLSRASSLLLYFLCSNGTGMLEEERTESPVSPKSEEIEQEVEIEPDEGPMPTEMEALEDDKEEPKIEEYDAELQVEEPGKKYLSANLQFLYWYFAISYALTGKLHRQEFHAFAECDDVLTSLP